MNRFEYTDSSGDKLVVLPAKGGILVEAENAPHVPLDRVEEVVAGLRDMARQAGGARPAPRRRLTELQHDAAWHAIEGAAGQDGADPGTVLAAVLRALDIDPPAVLAGMPITDALRARAAAVLPPGARITAQAIRDAEGAGA